MAILIPLAVVYVLAMFRWRKIGIAYQQKLVERTVDAAKRRDPYLAAATLIRKKDEITGEGAVSVQTHRIYRGEDGGYVLFICTSGGAGYMTRLTRDRAANALRSSPEIFQREFPDGV